MLIDLRQTLPSVKLNTDTVIDLLPSYSSFLISLFLLYLYSR